METDPLAHPENAAPAPATMSPWSRAVAMFASPTRAWAGLEKRGQWWFPLAVSILVAVAGTAVTYQRAIVPMMSEQFDRRVESGQLTQAQADQTLEQMSGPVAMGANLGSVVVMVPVMTLVLALLPWIGVGFMLGRPFRFRDAFVVTAWAGLVQIPAQLLAYGMGWANQSMERLHTGFGVLLPVEETPSRLMTALGIFLDYGIGPLQLWYVAVMALGAAALSGTAPRRAMTVVGALWLIAIVVVAGLSALFAPPA